MDGEQQSETTGRETEEALHVRAFLIADIRGYTRFTADRGDEAAAGLASAFASLTRAGVEQFGGEVVELRGDEALVVFSSTRQSIRAALDLQRRYSEHSETSPDLPLGVGIGIDAGEAVAVEGGFRGGALNLAARLCSIAGPGHVLASDAVTHLARKVDGIRYVELGARVFKGLEEPVRIVEIVPELAAEKAPLARISPAVLVDPGQSAPQRVPFADLGERIEALVEEHLKHTVGKWGTEGFSPPGGRGTQLREQFRQALYDARDASREAKRAERVARHAPPALPAPPPRRTQRQSSNEMIVSVIGGVIITLAILAVIVIIVLKFL